MIVFVTLSGFMSTRLASRDILLHGVHDKWEPEERAVDDEKNDHEDNSVAAESLLVDISRFGAT